MKSKIQTINKAVLVNAPQAKAFQVFTEQMDSWWPRTHHIGKTPATKFVLEPKAKGRWYSLHEDGSQCATGYVSVWQPHERLVLIWQIDGDFKFNPELVTEIEIRFIKDGPDRTVVQLEHRNLDRLSDGGKTADSMDQGWGMIINLYRDLANKNSERKKK